MWGWGGGGGGGDSPPAKKSPERDVVADDEDELTPPLEIGLPGDEADDALTESVTSDDPELRELREQFSMQEDLLGQLKGVLKSNEAKLHFKEREVEVSHRSKYFLVRMEKKRLLSNPHSTVNIGF